MNLPVEPHKTNAVVRRPPAELYIRRGSSRSSRGDYSRAKRRIIALFIVFRIMDALMFFAASPWFRPRMIGPILSSAVWTTGLLVLIWNRQNWARYILAVNMILIFVFSAILNLAAVDYIRNANAYFISLLCTPGHAAIACYLMASKEIKRLTRKYY